MLKKCLVPKGPLIAGLPVLLWGWAGEGGARFVASFQQTWGRLGPAVTDRLLEYWHPVTSEGRWVVDGPAHLDGRPARTLYPGRHLEFSASAVDEMPDALVGELIAHELARAFLYAQDGDSHGRWDDASRQRREALVDQLTRSWGFAPDSLREWAATRGVALE